MENHHAIIGKPTISMGHGFHGKLWNNHRVTIMNVREYSTW